jgi:hypothetical protein
MRNITFPIVLLFLSQNLFAQVNTIKKRSDCFFGVHFDFHADENSNKIGENFSASLIDSLLTVAKPDFIQVTRPKLETPLPVL